MGARAVVLVIVHVLGCAVVALLSFFLFALDESEGAAERGSAPEAVVLPLAMFVLGVGVWVALDKGRQRLAVLLLGAEAVVGIALWRALDSAGMSDYMLFLVVLVLGLSGLGAAAAASHGPRASV
jgi:uncharacterized membrane protein YsdA (DUF1294 family)